MFNQIFSQPLPPPRTAVEKFVAIALRLRWAVDTKRMFGPLPAPLPIVILILARISDIKERVHKLAEQIAAGTYKPRSPATAPRRKPANPKPWQPSPLPRHFNWLEALIPQAQPARAGVSALFQDPEMLALMAAAPEALRRPIRSFCWMVGFKPPPILARPRRPRRPTPPPPAPTPAAKPPARRKKATSSPSPLAGEGRGEGSPHTPEFRRTT